MTSLEELAARRGRLIERARGEREKIAGALAPLAGALNVIERGRAAYRWLRERPLLVAAAIALTLLARPRRGLRLLRFALGAWQAWRWAAGALRAATQEGRGA